MKLAGVQRIVWVKSFLLEACVLHRAHVTACSLLSALQFERTLIIAEDDSQVSYLEGCTAPSYDTNQVSAVQHSLNADPKCLLPHSSDTHL